MYSSVWNKAQGRWGALALGPVGRAGLDNLAVLHLAAVGNGHDAADGNDGVIFEDGHDTLRDGVFGQHAVHVRVDEVRIGRGVQARVDGVGLGASVLLVHHDEAVELRIGRFQQAAVGLGVDVLHVGKGHFHQLEVLYQQFQGLVLAAVVDDDDLEDRVVLRQQRVDVVHDGLLFVIGRTDDGYTRGVGALVDDVLGVGRQVGVLAAQDAHFGQPHQDDVGYDQPHRIEEDDVSVEIEY